MFSSSTAANAASGINLNNALNLFPTTSGPQQTQTKLAKLIYNATGNARGPTEIQNTLARSLYDDAVQYMNTLDMNRAASYTFGHRNSYGQNGTTANDLGGGTRGESIATEMWELVVDLTLEKFTQHSVLALTKTLSLIQHVLLHGSEAVVTDGELLYRLEVAVRPLRQLNTALAEQQTVEQILNNEQGSGRASGLDIDIGQQLAQFGTRASAAMLKMRGGSVDRGHPVRVAAGNLYGMASNPTYLRQMRMQQQQGASSSLVPIGSSNQVGYITDDARLQLLRQKMAREEEELKQKRWTEQQRLKQTRSNLAGKGVDSFGGGYSAGGGGGGGKIVVGAANSLEDMIRSAKYELEQHKTKHARKISSAKKGYCDDPYARSQRVQELESNNIGMDPKFREKEKALQDALEYLEEMQQEEREKVGDLLEGDLLGGGGPALGDDIDGRGMGNNLNGDVFSAGGGGVGNSSVIGGDLLGFNNNPTTTVAAAPTMDVFGGTAPSLINSGGGATHDLLGFDGLSSSTMNNNQGLSGGAYNPGHQTMSAGPTSGGNMPVPSTNFENNMNNSIMGANNNNFDMRPSLVTGMRGDAGSQGGPSSQPSAQSFNGIDNNNVPVMGGGGFQDTPVGPPQPQQVDEVAEAEQSRKMQMAAGLFAGVLPSSQGASATTQQRKPIMQAANISSNISALDELIPPLDAVTMAPTMPTVTASNNPVAAFDNANNNPDMPSIPSSDPFGMGAGGIMGVGGNSGGDNDNGSGNAMGIPPPPPMAPPPPPSMEPPPPTMAPPPPSTAMAMAPTMAPPPPPVAMAPTMTQAPPGASVEQMQAMIQQQQAQMHQMMQMMQQMQMQGGANNNANNGTGGSGAMGGWPPSSS